jgi:hypothetical protein
VGARVALRTALFQLAVRAPFTAHGAPCKLPKRIPRRLSRQANRAGGCVEAIRWLLIGRTGFFAEIKSRAVSSQSETTSVLPLTSRRTIPP